MTTASTTMGQIRLLLALVIAPIGLISAQSILLDNFQLETELGMFSSPAKLTFMPDGTMWTANNRGRVTVSSPNRYNRKRDVLNLQSVICENGERGLSSVAVHPDFQDNPFIFVSYNFKKFGNCNENANNGPTLRISRFRCDRDNFDCDINSEEVYAETPSFPKDHHNAGDINFGKDGHLYASIGDGGVRDTSQDNTNLFGTIIRLTDGNNIPSDNPFADESNSQRCGLQGGESTNGGKCQEIYAYGLRNPFRFSMNPNRGRTEFYINDVGASIWEEISVGGDNHAGANYGWPVREGPCQKGSECGSACRIGPDEYEEPLHYYHHNSDGDGAITAGAFVPDGSAWPAEFAGKYLYADFVFGQIYRLDNEDRNDDRSTCPVESGGRPVPIVNFPNGSIASMAFGPHDGHLYFLTRGGGGRLNRISFTGSSNRSPQPKIVASVTSGNVGEKIEFDARESTDPDGDDLTYEWDFDDDDLTDSTAAVASFTFNEPGMHKVTLKVRDGSGGRASTSIDIGIGDHPDGEILLPEEGASFYVGKEILLKGAVTGSGMVNDPSATISWEVKQHHSTHFHPYLEATKGNDIILQRAPAPEDFLASTNSYLEVIMTVTNSLGLYTTKSRTIMPEMVDVNIMSEPEGQLIRVDGYDVTTPVRIVTWKNHDLSLEAVNPSNEPLAFESWSNGGDQNQMVTIPRSSDEQLEYTALFQTVSKSETIAPSLAPVEQTARPIEATQPLDPTTQPIEPTVQPIEPTVQPIEPTIQPIESTTQPNEPTVQPIEPTIQPIETTMQPINQTAQPIDGGEGNATVSPIDQMDGEEANDPVAAPTVGEKPPMVAEKPTGTGNDAEKEQADELNSAAGSDESSGELTTPILAGIGAAAVVGILMMFLLARYSRPVPRRTRRPAATKPAKQPKESAISSFDTAETTPVVVKVYEVEA